MKPESRVNQLEDRGRLFLASVLLIALASTHQVSAAEVSPAEGIGAESHHCKCGMKCRGASCCCSPRPDRPRPQAAEPTPESGRVDAAPCLDAAPCGDPGLPSAPSGGPVGKGEAMAAVSPPRLDAAGRLLLFPPAHLLPARRASRLDRPPELLGLV